MTCAFQAHHRVRKLRGSELEAALATQEDGDNESLSEKSIVLLPMVEASVRGTFDKIMKQKQKEGISNSEAKSSIYDALLEQKVELILTAHPIKVNQIAVQSFE